MSGRIAKPLAIALVSLNASFFGLQYLYNQPLSPRLGDHETSSWYKIAQTDPLRRLRDPCLIDSRTTPADLIIQDPERRGKGPAFNLLDSPGKGMGLFATEDIPKGANILQEKAVIACANQGQKVGWRFGAEDLQNFAGQMISLSPHLQREVHNLQGKHVLSAPLMGYYRKILSEDVRHADGSRLSWRESLRLQEALRVFYTNAGTLYEAEPGTGWFWKAAEREVGDGLFLMFSRINHSCDPNAAWDTGRAPGVMEVRAKRHIRPGEEITISYINQLEKPTDERRQRLRRWGFVCQCSKCGPLIQNKPQDS